MIETLNQIDAQVFLFFNSMHCEFFDTFMKLFTKRFIWVPMYASILLLLFRRYSWRRATVYLLAIVLAITLADQVCATWIRPAVERLRPSNPANPLSAMVHIVDGYRGGSYGFPSCHGANSFALATMLALIFPRRRFILFILGWAAVNSYSRLYLGVHYPGDLLVGAVIGSTGAVICFYASRAIAGRIETVSQSRLQIPARLGAIFQLPSGVSLRVSDVMIFTGVTTAALITVMAVWAVIS